MVHVGKCASISHPEMTLLTCHRIDLGEGLLKAAEENSWVLPDQMMVLNFTLAP